MTNEVDRPAPDPRPRPTPSPAFGAKDVLFRAIATLGAIVIYRSLNILINPASTLLSGEAATGQFDNSAAAYTKSTMGMDFLGFLSIPAFVLLAVVIAIWWKYLRRGWAVLMPTVMLLSVLLPAAPARAYYDKNDYTEAYFILPNESAFFIPDVGANQTTQAKFGSAEYYDANKVPAKRFIIPHARFSGSGAWSDFYVPTGRLIIVDRSPYNREWVAARDRGTSAKNESFPCQSQEGINITAEVAIAASVTEDNAARFLYWFGVRPPQGNRNDPAVIFTSVFYGRGLADIMDSVGRGKVQALVCHEIGSRTFDKVNQDIDVIMDTVEKTATAYFATKGITLDYIGWAGTLSFDKDIQQAINDRYTAEKIAPVLAVLQTKALLDASTKWNGALPESLSGLWLVPPDVWGAVTGWLTGNAHAGAEPVRSVK